MNKNCLVSLHVVFIVLITCWHFNIYEHDRSPDRSCLVEHEKLFSLQENIILCFVNKYDLFSHDLLHVSKYVKKYAIKYQKSEISPQALNFLFSVFP